MHVIFHQIKYAYNCENKNESKNVVFESNLIVGLSFNLNQGQFKILNLKRTIIKHFGNFRCNILVIRDLIKHVKGNEYTSSRGKKMIWRKMVFKIQCSLM